MTDWPAPGETKTLSLNGPVGEIEAQIQLPKAACQTGGVALICHPHPLHGGAMSNKVTYMLASTAVAAGFAALRFNFRGVGGSAGEHDGGIGEREDAVFLAETLRAKFPDNRLLLAGFSFGADIALSTAEQVAPAALVTVAPPLSYLAADADWGGPTCPWLLLHGHDDEVVPYERTMARLSRFARAPRIAEFDGVGHFFHGKVSQIRATVLPFLNGLQVQS